MFQKIKTWWQDTCNEARCVDKTQYDNLLFVCKIPIHWIGVSELLKTGNDELEEEIVVHVYAGGRYKVFQTGICEIYNKFRKFESYFEAYKQTKDVAHIEEWITWKRKGEY